MRALDHVDLTPANITANSLPVPDPDSAAPWWAGAGEAAWAVGTAYTIGKYVVRGTRVYLAIAASTGADPALAANRDKWKDAYPVNALAWADMKTSTYTYAEGSYEATVAPGAVADVNLEGLVNVDTVRVVVLDAPGGAVIYDETISTLWWGGDPWVSWFFDMPYQRDRAKFSGLPTSLTARITVTLTAYNGGPLQVSQICFGRFVDLGCAEFGIEMRLRNFGKLEYDDWGNTTQADGLVVVDLVGNGVVPAADANRVAEFVRRHRNRVMVWEASANPAYDYLSSTGIAECTLRAEGPAHARLGFNLSGIGA